jgi:uncharacterized protein YukE
MSELIKLSCSVADIYQRYRAIHGTLFGASYLRRMLDTLRGRAGQQYGGFSQTLNAIQNELDALESQIRQPNEERPVTGADRQLRNALLDYTQNLNRAVNSLESICSGLGQDQAAYRKVRADGRSQFTADKLEYDQLLSELERRGTRLEKLFANY